MGETRSTINGESASTEEVLKLYANSNQQANDKEALKKADADRRAKLIAYAAAGGRLSSQDEADLRSNPGGGTPMQPSPSTATGGNFAP